MVNIELVAIITIFAHKYTPGIFIDKYTNAQRNTPKACKTNTYSLLWSLRVQKLLQNYILCLKIIWWTLWDKKDIKLIIIGRFYLNRVVRKGFPKKITFMDKDSSKQIQRPCSRKVHDTLEQENRVLHYWSTVNKNKGGRR